jgi:hypothetical protein
MSPRNFLLRGIFFALIFTLAHAGFVYAQTSTFTYQGRFTDGGTAANGVYDMQFKLFDTPSVGAGNQIGSTITNGAVTVTNGVFTVQLDYSAAAFPGADRFVEIGVRLAGSGDPYTVLSPRQPLTSTPYAIRAGATTTADTATTATTATNATQLGGVAASEYVRTGDARLSDSRSPSAGSSNYIQNTNSQQAATFNISGNGTAGGTLAGNIVNATTQFNLNGTRVLHAPGTGNLFAGASAGAANTAGQRNSFFGVQAGLANASGNDNAFFGNGAGSLSAASDNSFFGSGAGSANTTGTTNSFFGSSAGSVNGTASGNSFFGYHAGKASTTDGNSFFGTSAGESNTMGAGNSFFGYRAGPENEDGSSNAFVGHFAGRFNKSGSDNTFIGYAAGQQNQTTSQNTYIGAYSGKSNNLGSNNVALGYAADILGSFSNSTAIGAFAIAKQSNSTAIGAFASATQSNSLVLGGISGVNGGTDTNVGIGTSAPKAKLDVRGGNILIAHPNSLIITSPNSACWFITVSNTGVLSTTSVACP